MATANTTTTGKSAQTTPKDPHNIELKHAAAYALARQVPDITDRGCTISTTYGDMVIPPGRLAVKLAALLHREISRGARQ